MTRLALLVLAAFAAVVAIGCGTTEQRRESNLSVRSAEQPQTPEQRAAQAAAPGSSTRQVRIAVVTHGQASDPFWAVVRTGINQAARQMGVSVTYASPDTYDLNRMSQLIDQAVSRKPDGLVVTIPDAHKLGGAIRGAERAGIPVISINAGITAWKQLGALTHVGEPDGEAGLAAGRRLAAAGVKNALCVNQEPGNSALSLRCSSFAAGLRRDGGASTVVAIDLQDRAGAVRKIAAAISAHHPDGMLTLGPTSAGPALDALRRLHLLGKVRLATFDLSPDVIQAIRDGNIAFAVDQQPYLQGYLPIVYLAQYARYGVLPDRGRVSATGPSFVTKADAASVQRLAEAGIR